MPEKTTIRSVKIDQSERGGWSSERPLPVGETQAAPPVRWARPRRCRLLSPSNRLVYRQDSVIVVAGADDEHRRAFVARLFDEKLTLRVEALRDVVGKQVPEERVEQQLHQVLASVAQRRLAFGQAVIVEASALTDSERSQLAALAGDKPAHLILIDATKDSGLDADLLTVAGQARNSVMAGMSGQEGFATAVVLTPRVASQVQRVALGRLAEEN